MGALQIVFVRARLLTTNQLGDGTTIEISHETLIREWARLSSSLMGAREDIRLQQTFTKDVAEWKLHKRPNDRLYRGSKLKEAKVWSVQNFASSDENVFLQLSIKHQRRTRISIIILLLLPLFIVIFSTFIVQYYSQSSQILPSQLSTNQTIIESNNSQCKQIAGNYQCIINLRETDRSTSNVHWVVSSDFGNGINFSPKSGNLQPGKSITVTISAIPCQNGTFSFSGSGGTSPIAVFWLCPPQSTQPRLSLVYHRFTLMNLDYVGLLQDSPPAIASVKQKVKAQSFLQGRSAGLVVIYGGAPSNADIGQAIAIDEKVRNILVTLGQEGFAFQRASYYTSLYLFATPPSTVQIDIYLFQ